jgi:periplasmic iron binding protein
VGRSWSGPLVTALIVVGIAAILIFNFQPARTPPPPPPPPGPKVDPDLTTTPKGSGSPRPGVKENPICEPVEKNHIRIVAVWLSAVKMEGMAATSPNEAEMIHLEADVKATQDNPNGFAKDEFVPYLKIAYSIVPAKGGSPIDKGELSPMVAWDGLHYGANILMPKPGEYRLIYDVQPPSAGGLGRHSDPATGVDPWWKPFQAEFCWTVEPKSAAVAGSR